ncbi:MAG: hypothetical protein P4L44_15380 [Oryzomonas sp.]|uniref:hypothetical protein n=1 Tax=Oryzomonas sp. TaxID=2855186 RepID=UPI00283CEC3C|nr:hypothetical protein [Oryzomonas sp.]MDR3581341.1 hypothetical protein [Oryzomonas sp.]
MTCKRLFCLFAGVTVVLASTFAWSAEIHGISSTQYGWFTDIFTGNKQAEFGEYLNLSITKVDTEGKLSFQGYGRVTEDVRNGSGNNGRLYYLYGDYSNLYDKVDLRFGRQFVNYAAGSALIDGGKIDLKNVGPIAFSVMGGRNVIFGLDGEASQMRAFAFGAAAYLAGFKNTDAELSYFMKFDNDGLARDQIGATFKQYYNSFKFYANTRFDLPSETFNELLTGVKYFPMADLVLTAEWYQSYPTFDSTSIYSIFAVDRYQEALIRGDYTINDKLSVNAGYTRQFYGEGNDGSDVIEIGCRIRPIENLQVNLNFDRNNGYGGNLSGGSIDATYRPIKPLEVAAGLQYDVYVFDRTTGNETARKYWLGGKYKLTKNTSASVRVEDNDNAQYKSDWQGRVVFNYEF